MAGWRFPAAGRRCLPPAFSRSSWACGRLRARSRPGTIAPGRSNGCPGRAVLRHPKPPDRRATRVRNRDAPAMAVASANKQQRTDRARIENLPRLLEGPVIAMVESYSHQRASGLRRIRHCVQLPRTARARLLDEARVSRHARLRLRSVASISCVVATITISTSRRMNRGVPIGDSSAPGCAAASAAARARVRHRSRSPAGRRPTPGRASLPIRPHPTIATFRGIGSPPVRITDLCDVSLILPAYNEAATIASTIRETGSYFRSRGLRLRDYRGCRRRRRYPRIGRRDRYAWRAGARDRQPASAAGRAAACARPWRWRAATSPVTRTPTTKYPSRNSISSGHGWAQGCDVAIGSRAMQDSQIEKRQPLYRQLGGKGFGLFMHAVVGLAGITDTQCGFKFFTRSAAREIFSRQQIDGYMFDVEILVMARRLGYRIQQVPIRWRDDGDSRLALVSGNLRNVPTSSASGGCTAA